MKTIIAFDLIFLSLCSQAQSTGASSTHTLVLVGTSGSVYRLGYLKPTSFPSLLKDRLSEIRIGSTVTCIAYDSETGYYPWRTTANSLKDVLPPVRERLKEARDYWSDQFVKTGGILSRASRAGSRLDKALELAMSDRKSWPENADVTVYFLTDGGVDFRSISKSVAEQTAELRLAKTSIKSAFDTLCHDSRVKHVFVAGLKEQASNRYPNDIFEKNTIVRQWMEVWLERSHKVQQLTLPN